MTTRKRAIICLLGILTPAAVVAPSAYAEVQISMCAQQATGISRDYTKLLGRHDCTELGVQTTEADAQAAITDKIMVNPNNPGCSLAATMPGMPSIDGLMNGDFGVDICSAFDKVASKVEAKSEDLTSQLYKQVDGVINDLEDKLQQEMTVEVGDQTIIDGSGSIDIDLPRD